MTWTYRVTWTHWKIGNFGHLDTKKTLDTGIFDTKENSNTQENQNTGKHIGKQVNFDTLVKLDTLENSYTLVMLARLENLNKLENLELSLDLKNNECTL